MQHELNYLCHGLLVGQVMTLSHSDRMSERVSSLQTCSVVCFRYNSIFRIYPSQLFGQSVTNTFRLTIFTFDKKDLSSITWSRGSPVTTKWLHRYFFDPSYCIFQVLCVYSKRCLSVVVPRSPMKLQIIINQSNNDLHSSDKENRVVEGGGLDVLFIPEDGSPAPVLLLGIVQTYPGSTDIKICR